MSKISKEMVAIIVCFSMIFAMCSVTQAKTYYEKKYDDYEHRLYPHEGECDESIASVAINSVDDKSQTVTQDFDQDGVKEKVKLTGKISKNYKKANISVKIDKKTVLKKKIPAYINLSFSTYMVDGQCIAVLMYGDEDYAGGGAFIYRWKKNNTLKLLKKVTPKGYLGICTGNDITEKRNVLYVMDQVQMSNVYGSKWPKNVLKRYKKYAKKEGASVTKRTYEKYIYKKGKLKKIATDKYYYVGSAYD